MTGEEFMKKWKNTVDFGFWVKNPSTVYWSRSYLMEQDTLEIMSRDYLSIPRIEDSRCSSLELARYTLR